MSEQAEIKLNKPHLAVRLIKSNIVLLIALLAAVVTCFFVPPDGEYLGYFDFRTISCLFCTLAVVCAFKRIHFFEWLAEKIVITCGNMRKVTFALVFITYIGSMILANDMALITFLPLGYYVLHSCNKHKYMAFVFIMQNVAANLGGMLTPFGNPQNLYIFSFFNIPTLEFMSIMAVPFAVAFVLIFACCFFVKPESVTITTERTPTPKLWRVMVYFVLFALSVLAVLCIFPYYIGLIIVTVAVLILEPKALLRVDYGLLLTFCAFFVFSGNMGRIPAVIGSVGALVCASPLLVGTLSCQVISNVPSAILLSQFTTDYKSLLIAVNIGGLGTPIASLASLITLGEFRRRQPHATAKYLGMFSLINFSFLIILYITGVLVCM